ncbi:Methyltransferase domain-containing protein [Marinococcus luteus]|uniref:Methyltransferase domain-containing protein n=1 Tax=Marinococcus luteus TaxID=1122204 RepID=A0A1H2RKK9_9BACI|nr:class I SAM-dependent methyltransferase [Marinococcus luteus]SDW20006.1 Methyltransferase domain-containing protein [Marinococcus luteus]
MSHRFDPSKSKKLRSEERQQALPMAKLLPLMNIQETDLIADVGAGNGYFTIPMAERARHVYAVDIEDQMLTELKAYAEEARASNITLILSGLEQITLTEHQVHKIVVAFVMHEIDDMDQAFAEFRRILKPGGTIFFYEWEATATESGPPLEIRLPSDAFARTIESYGFTTTLHVLNDGHYMVEALKT